MPALCDLADVPSIPRVMVNAEPTFAVTSTISSFAESFSMTRTNGYEAGKPESDATWTDVSLVPMDDTSVVRTAVEE